MFEQLKQKILFALYKYCEKKIDVQVSEVEIVTQQMARLYDERMQRMEAEFDEKMIRVVEIMMETKLEVVGKVNDLIINNENWITNYYFKDVKEIGGNHE